MLIRVLTSFADGNGRLWKQGRTYQLDDAEAQRMIDAGAALRVPTDAEVTAALLKEQGGGLLTNSTTTKALIKACKDLRIKVQPVKKGAAGKAAAKVREAVGGKKEDPPPEGDSDSGGDGS